MQLQLRTVLNTYTDRTDMGIGPKIWSSNRFCRTPVRREIAPKQQERFQRLSELCIYDPSARGLRQDNRRKTQSGKYRSRDCVWRELRRDVERVDGE